MLLKRMRTGDILGAGVLMIGGQMRRSHRRSTPPATELPVVLGAH
jgi:enamidase